MKYMLNRTVENNNVSENLILAILFSIIFLPTFPFFGNIRIRLDDILIYFGFPVLLLSSKKIPINKLVVLWILPIASMVTSTLWGYLFLNVSYTYRDILELVRFLKPILLLIMLSKCNIYLLKSYLERFFILGSVTLIIIAFIQYTNIYGLGKEVALIYSSEYHASAVVSSFKRSTLTGANANIAGGLVLVFLVNIYVKLLVKKKISYAILTFFLFLTLLSTSSRTAIIGFGGVLIFSLLILRDINAIFKIFLIAIISSIFALSYERLKYLSLGFELLRKGQLNSVNIRIENFQHAIKLFKESPLLGWGVAKAHHRTFIDGEHFLLLRRYGIVGYLLIIFSLGYYPIKFFFTNRIIKKIDSTANIYSMYSLMMFISLLVLMLTNKLYGGNQIINIYTIIVGFQFYYLNSLSYIEVDNECIKK